MLCYGLVCGRVRGYAGRFRVEDAGIGFLCLCMWLWLCDFRENRPAILPQRSLTALLATPFFFYLFIILFFFFLGIPKATQPCKLCTGREPPAPPHLRIPPPQAPAPLSHARCQCISSLRCIFLQATEKIHGKILSRNLSSSVPIHVHTTCRPPHGQPGRAADGCQQQMDVSRHDQGLSPSVVVATSASPQQSFQWCSARALLASAVLARPTPCAAGTHSFHIHMMPTHSR